VIAKLGEIKALEQRVLVQNEAVASYAHTLAVFHAENKVCEGVNGSDFRGKSALGKGFVHRTGTNIYFKWRKNDENIIGEIGKF